MPALVRMSVAVLSGREAGKVLRATRSRISIGADEDNDLVLRDPDVAPFHLNIVIEDEGWRAEPVSSAAQIAVDKRWTHPRTGKKGALLYAAATELLLYPGELEDNVIQRELRTRKTDEHLVVITERNLAPVRPSAPPSSLRRSLPPMAPVEDAASAAPTQNLQEALARAKIPHDKTPLDPLLMSSLPTIGDAPMADILAGRRPEPAIVVEPVASKTSGSAWERASRGRSMAIPEVLAEPESQMTRVPGSEKSLMGFANVSDENTQRDILVSSPPSARVDSDMIDTAGSDGAWSVRGIPKSATEVDPPPNERGAPSRSNAWGDGAKPATGRAPPPPPPVTSPSNPRPSPSKSSGTWQDRPKPSRPPPPEPSRALAPYVGDTSSRSPELSMAVLAERVGEPALAVVRDPDGALATAVRLFVTRLLDLERSHGYRAYMLTSAEPLTGKTTVALNVAFALAEDPRRRVALVEADFRNPRMGEILDLPPELGLLGVLEGRLSVPEASVRVADRNLVLFPSGGRHASPAEVLASPRFKTVIQELAQSVDVAIIDAPPVKPTADANLLLPLVDGAMLVVLNEETRGAWIEQALEQLGVERVLGAVYNTVDKRTRKAILGERKRRMAGGAQRA